MGALAPQSSLNFGIRLVRPMWPQCKATSYRAWEEEEEEEEEGRAIPVDAEGLRWG